MMYLIHPEHGARISWSLFEQNILLTDGWHEVTAEEYRAAPSGQVDASHG